MAPRGKYLPISVADVAAWQVQARTDFVRKTFGIVTAQLFATLAVASLPTLVPSVRDYVLSHVGLAYVAMLMPLLLTLYVLRRDAHACTSYGHLTARASVAHTA